jgi:hypothetical protein
MSCDVVTKFTITKGLDNTFEFTIKAQGSTLPMVIVEPDDTFSAQIVDLATDIAAVTLPLTVTDAANGKVTLVVDAFSTMALTGEKGSKADRYYLRPTYKLVIDCSTTNNGDFIAKVPEVYVD